MLKIFLALVFVLSTAACSKPETKFLGEWQHPKNDKVTLGVVRNGDGFLVISKGPGFAGRPPREEKTAAVIKDGQLQITGPFGLSSIAYIEATDTISVPTMGGAVEYRRIK
jgi:hypothetical protein